MAENPERFGIGGLQNNIIGGDIASASTIAPTSAIHTVTGTTAVVTITPPWVGFAGIIILIAGGIYTWTAAGNIAVAGTSTAVGRAIPFVYVPSLGKWYPMVVA